MMFSPILLVALLCIWDPLGSAGVTAKSDHNIHVENKLSQDITVWARSASPKYQDHEKVTSQ